MMESTRTVREYETGARGGGGAAGREPACGMQRVRVRVHTVLHAERPRAARYDDTSTTVRVKIERTARLLRVADERSRSAQRT
jgi:hypothetical protein